MIYYVEFNNEMSLHGLSYMFNSFIYFVHLNAS